MAETCQANIGLYLGGAVPVAESLARAFGCGDPATVTLRGGCVHGHVKEKRYCARHGVLDPDDAAWFCLDCAQAGHDCPVTVELVVTP